MSDAKDEVLRISTDAALEKVVADLTNAHRWPWTNMISMETAAREMLILMRAHGLVEGRRHPFGGDVWLINGKLFGRVDGITVATFHSLKHG